MTDPICVLHVDDEPDFADMAAEFIERHNDRFNVETVMEASEALGRLSETRFDCIVSDLDMPGQNGIDFLESVREDYPDLPFVLYTGKGSEEVASDAISAGVTDYLQKEGGTHQYAILANRVRNAVEKQRALQDRQRSERNFEAIFQDPHMLVGILDPDGTLRNANQTAMELIDSDHEEVQGTLFWEAPWWADDDRDNVHQWVERAASGEYVEFEAVHLTPNGKRRNVLGTLRPVMNENGDVVSLIASSRDVTNREEHKRQLETLIKNLPGMVYRCQNDPDWPMEFVGGECEDLTGYPAGALETNEVRYGADVIHPEDRADVWNSVQEALANQESFELTYRIITKTDSQKWVWERGRGIRSVDGEPTALEGFISDITARKEHEHELELKTRAMDEAPVGILITDATSDEYPIIYANQHFQRITGYSEAEILGRNSRFLQGERTDSDPVAQMREAIDGQNPVTVELRNFRKDGTEFWNRVSIAPVRDKDGNVTHCIGFQQDISAQRQQQATLENHERVLREMYDVMADRHRPFAEQVNDLLTLGRTELETAYGTLSEIQGDDYIFKFVDTDDETIQEGDVVPVSATNCEIAASTQQTLVLGDVARDAPDETDRAGYTDWGIACYIGAPVYVEDEVFGTFCFYDLEPREGQFSEWEETLVDLMSRWVSYELQRQQANERLQRQNERLDRFASVVTHDLRNPLNVLQGSLELAEEKEDMANVRRARRAADRMEILIDDLLSLARQGEVVTEKEPVDLVRLVEFCWENVRTGNATLHVDTDQVIDSDERRLQQLLENLLRNAIEFGGEEVAVSVGALENGFYVEDNGPGISADVMEQVFESGYTTNEEGTGLGLSIVEEIVKAHGWTIRVTSGENGGARFEITDVASEQ